MEPDNGISENEIRRDYRTGFYAIIAPRRGKRPVELEEEDVVSSNLASCPFERGNESTSREIMRLGNPWTIRVIENRFPELTGGTPLTFNKASNGLFESIGGYGYNEVVILSPNHSDTLDSISAESALDWLNVLVEREEALYSRKYIKYVQVFHNYGAIGGASVGHPHTQIIAWPVLIGTIKREKDRAKKYRDFYFYCLY